MPSTTTPKIKLDPSKLLGFDQAPALTAPKVGTKRSPSPPPPPPPT